MDVLSSPFEIPETGFNTAVEQTRKKSGILPLRLISAN